MRWIPLESNPEVIDQSSMRSSLALPRYNKIGERILMMFSLRSYHSARAVAVAETAAAPAGAGVRAAAGRGRLGTLLAGHQPRSVRLWEKLFISRKRAALLATRIHESSY